MIRSHYAWSERKGGNEKGFIRRHGGVWACCTRI